MGIYDINGKVLSSSGNNALIEDLTKWNGKSLVTDGNSLVDSVNWGDYLAEYLGMLHTNCGNSGGELARGTMADIKANVRDNYPNKCDLVILQGDSNVGDVNGDATQQMDGADPQNTWTARINYLIRCIKAKYPNVIIVLIPESVRYDSPVGQNPPSPNIWYEKNRISYIMMKKIADYNRHIFWAFDGDTPFDPVQNSNYYANKTAISNFTENDGTHPNGKFARAKGKALAWWCAGLTFDPDAPNDSVAGWEDRVTAPVTANYTGVTSDVNATGWQYYMPYIANLTASSGTIKSCKVLMGGKDVTADVYANGKITIKRVTGPVEITASASA